MATFARIRLAAVIVVLIVPAVLFPLVGGWALLWLPCAMALLGAALARPELLAAALGPLTARLGVEEGEPRKETDVRDSAGELRERPDQGDEPAPVEAPRGRTGTRGVRTRRIDLPSAVDDYAFGFSALVHWRWAHRVDLSLRNPAGPAVRSVVLRAREVLRDVHPSDWAVAESELESAFAVEEPVCGGTIQVWAESVRLDLDDEDEVRLDRMAHLRKDRALWAAEHEAARVRASMSDEIGDVIGPGGGTRPGREPEPRYTAAAHDLPGAPDLVDLSDVAVVHGPHGTTDLREDLDQGPPTPGSGVDEEGYESYWWPAEQEPDEGGMEQDVQVAILRGLIDSVEGEAERAAFVREQVEILERSGFPDVAERIQSVYPER
ncbi:MULTISPECIES: hypothetical protein [unclassified Nocardiopsis]|uniref:hypothetical protein n=1 Tax=unclassified Nocardiopsis TaxID=2649073 RepID=UPI0033E71C76